MKQPHNSEPMDLADALRDPEAFVAGMSEEVIVHTARVGHSPGPWRIEAATSITKGARDYALYGAGDIYLGAFTETSDDPSLQARGWLPTQQGEANARLIAAAPDLLAACESLLSVYAPLYSPTEATDAFGAAVIKARAAVAKATGETP